MARNISQNALGGYFGLYYNTSNMVVVDMGEVDIVTFDVYPAIGTYGLNGCTVAIAASPFAAILAHIPPRPDLTTADPYAGDSNTRAIMAEFTQLYETYIDFIPDANSHIICAVYRGQQQPALSDQLAIILEAFRAMGLEPEVHHYAIQVDFDAVGEGTVLVASPGSALEPIVYIQDEPV